MVAKLSSIKPGLITINVPINPNDTAVHLFTPTFSFKSAFISSICRVFIGPLIGLGIIKMFTLSGFAAGVFLIQCAMPSAVLTYLIGSMYSPKKIVDSIASMIVVSTIMSFITLPIVVFFALKYFY